MIGHWPGAMANEGTWRQSQRRSPREREGAIVQQWPRSIVGAKLFSNSITSIVLSAL